MDDFEEFKTSIEEVTADEIHVEETDRGVTGGIAEDAEK